MNVRDELSNCPEINTLTDLLLVPAVYLKETMTRYFGILIHSHVHHCGSSRIGQPASISAFSPQHRFSHGDILIGLSEFLILPYFHVDTDKIPFWALQSQRCSWRLVLAIGLVFGSCSWLFLIE